MIVDDCGNLLNKVHSPLTAYHAELFIYVLGVQGTPCGQLPDIIERSENYKIVSGSKYSRAANYAMHGPLHL